ncbi:unnamed protein product [Penicillium glandicola]
MAPHFGFWRKKLTDMEKARQNLMKQYDGKNHRSSGMRFRQPSANLEIIEDRMMELDDARLGYNKQKYLNPRGDDEHEKYTDLDTYYSATKEYPRRLVVQSAPTTTEAMATPEAYGGTDHPPRNWRQRRIRGNIPFVITLSEFCLNPFGLSRFDGGEVKKYKEKGNDVSQNQKNLIWKTIIQILSALFTLAVSTLHWITSILLTLTLSWIIPAVLFVEICTAPWTETDATETYEKYQNFQWKWPKHAMNLLDQSPRNPHRQSKVASLTIPRRLVVKDPTTGQWVARETEQLRAENTGMLQPYIFLSFSRANYLEKKTDEEIRQMLYQVAERMLRHENKKTPEDPPLEAFWVDVDCVSKDGSVPVGGVESERTRDVNTICDAVRCAKRVYVVLPTESANDKRIWGERIWTFPEVLLAANKIRYCFTHSTSMSLSEPHDLTLNDMKNSFWQSPQPSKSGLDEHEGVIDHLINHYTGTLRLSELQLFTFAVQAMAQQTTGINIKGYTTRDMAYAAMGLLSYRLTPNDTDNVFQAIARLSIVNDSNQLLERLLCLSPSPKNPTVDTLPGLAPASSDTILRNIADQDEYGTHLWDIKPLCDVVGVGGDIYEPTVIVDRSRGIPIRWKNFPKLKYIKAPGGGLSAAISHAIIFLSNGANLISSATALGGSTYQFIEQDEAVHDVMQAIRVAIVPNYLVVTLMVFGVAWIFSWFSPWAVRKLCTDKLLGTSSHLVGFEGTMPLHDLEKLMYGNFNDRLSYTTSSTVFSGGLRDHHLRLSKEPENPSYWKEKFQELGHPKTHRLFTIVDTGDMTVSVISAERPPVVALMCGREGGMLRVLLCSWRFETNCLYREGVVRMRSSLEEQSTHNDWLKISLASQGDVNRARVGNLKKNRSSTSGPSLPSWTE